MLVGAGDDFYHLAIAGTLSASAVGVAPAVGVNIIGNTTEAYIGKNATVKALGDISVAASGKENVVMVGFGISAGAIAVGGAVDVLSIDNTTKGYIDDSATVFAGGDALVFADDNTQVLELSGALAGGFVGVGASVGVMLITKDTEATIGSSAHVDALANSDGFLESNGGIANVLDGTINGGTTLDGGPGNNTFQIGQIYGLQRDGSTTLPPSFGSTLGESLQPQDVFPQVPTARHRPVQRPRRCHRE